MYMQFMSTYKSHWIVGVQRHYSMLSAKTGDTAIHPDNEKVSIADTKAFTFTRT